MQVDNGTTARCTQSLCCVERTVYGWNRVIILNHKFKPQESTIRYCFYSSDHCTSNNIKFLTVKAQVHPTTLLLEPFIFY